MEIIYHNKKTEKICKDMRIAQKELGSVVARKLSALINMIEDFRNLSYMLPMAQYNLHALTGDRDGQYSFVIHKGSKWRLIVYPLDKDGTHLIRKDNETQMLIEAVMVEILEVSEHYA